MKKKIVLWWGRSDISYSRNRIIRKLFKELNYEIIDFFPLISCLAHVEAFLKNFNYMPSLIWVPCFRHRDVESAHIWSKKNNVPLVFDPLISSWDKKINERGLYSPKSIESKKILINESTIFNKADLIIADTECHADFYSKYLNISKKKISVVYVGAEEELFKPDAKNSINNKVLFYGSFIELHGIDTIIKAAEISTKKITWELIGDISKINIPINSSKLIINEAIDYEKLPNKINSADILLGIFSNSKKANNVIPNKVYQSLACGKAVITRAADAYPKKIPLSNDALFFIEPNNPIALSEKINEIYDKNLLPKSKIAAKKIFNKFFSEKIIKKQLCNALRSFNL